MEFLKFCYIINLQNGERDEFMDPNVNGKDPSRMFKVTKILPKIAKLMTY